MANKVVWYEVLGKDAQKRKGFFGELFGWQFKETPGLEYGMTNAEATGIGGGVGSSPQKGASLTTFYVGVEDIGSSLFDARRTVLISVS